MHTLNFIVELPLEDFSALARYFALLRNYI